MLCSHFAALSFYLLLALSLFLAGLENSQASKRYVMPARTGDTSLKLTFLNCQHLTCSPSLSMTASLSLSIRTLSLPLPFCILTLTLGSRSLSLLLLLPLLTCPAGWSVQLVWLPARTRTLDNELGGLASRAVRSTQHAKRNVQLSVSSEWQLQQKLQWNAHTRTAQSTYVHTHVHRINLCAWYIYFVAAVVVTWALQLTSQHYFVACFVTQG